MDRRTKIVDRVEKKGSKLKVDRSKLMKDGSTNKKMDRHAQKNGSTDKKLDRTKKMDNDRSGSKHRNRIDGRKNWIEPEILIEIVSLNGSKFDFYLNIKLSFLTFNLLERFQFRKQAPFLFNENRAWKLIRKTTFWLLPW